MISRVTVKLTEWNELPWKFEAGTSSYVDAIALGAAVDYLSDVGAAKIHAHELSLVAYLLPRPKEIPRGTVYGPNDLNSPAAVVTITTEAIHPPHGTTTIHRPGACMPA